MRVFAQVFWRPKDGNSEDEYEDAFWPRRLPSYDDDLPELRTAVADGATETSFSALWAKLLVRSYAEGRLKPERFEACLGELQRRWQGVVNRKQLQWYVEEKAKAGAAAAFVGLHIVDERHQLSGNWQATALGDSCLFQLRGEHVIERFPIKSASEFTSRPILLVSTPSNSDSWRENLRMASGTWLHDDSFLLMTDALADWFIREEEAGRMPWLVVRGLGTSDGQGFSEWVDEMRSAKCLRNDDVTLLRIHLA